MEEELEELQNLIEERQKSNSALIEKYESTLKEKKAISPEMAFSEIEAYLRKLKSNGKKITEFCEENEINYSSFQVQMNAIRNNKKKASEFPQLLQKCLLFIYDEVVLRKEFIYVITTKIT